MSLAASSDILMADAAAVANTVLPPLPAPSVSSGVILTPAPPAQPDAMEVVPDLPATTTAPRTRAQSKAPASQATPAPATPKGKSNASVLSKSVSTPVLNGLSSPAGKETQGVKITRVELNVSSLADRVANMESSVHLFREDLASISSLIKIATNEFKASSGPQIAAQMSEIETFVGTVRQDVALQAQRVSRLEQLIVDNTAATTKLGDLLASMHADEEAGSKRRRTVDGFTSVQSPFTSAVAANATPLPSVTRSMYTTPFAPGPGPTSALLPTTAPALTSGGTFANKPEHNLIMSRIPTGDVAVGEYKWQNDVAASFKSLYSLLPPTIARSLPRPQEVRRLGGDKMRARFLTAEDAVLFVNAWTAGPIGPYEGAPAPPAEILFVVAAHIERCDEAFVVRRAAPTPALKF